MYHPCDMRHGVLVLVPLDLIISQVYPLFHLPLRLKSAFFNQNQFFSFIDVKENMRVRLRLYLELHHAPQLFYHPQPHLFFLVCRCTYPMPMLSQFFWTVSDNILPSNSKQIQQMSLRTGVKQNRFFVFLPNMQFCSAEQKHLILCQNGKY